MAKKSLKEAKGEKNEDRRRKLNERLVERGTGLVVERADGTRLRVGPGGILTQEESGNGRTR